MISHLAVAHEIVSPLLEPYEVHLRGEEPGLVVPVGDEVHLDPELRILGRGDGVDRQVRARHLDVVRYRGVGEPDLRGLAGGVKDAYLYPAVARGLHLEHHVVVPVPQGTGDRLGGDPSAGVAGKELNCPPGQLYPHQASRWYVHLARVVVTVGPHRNFVRDNGALAGRLRRARGGTGKGKTGQHQRQSQQRYGYRS